ncbi:MAG: helix-turn-helix domain-containing protein [Oscillospiraceae bacterium]|nr:helix-turn-helix domain-containing protein [Oscillospiraceae bacterium]
MAERRYTREGYLKENYHYFHLRDTAGAELDFHFHEFDKLVLLLDGRVDYALESIVYPLRPWDILLVRHHTIHKALVDKSVPYERIILYLDRKYFDRLMPEARLFGSFDRADERAEYLLSPDEEQRAQLAAVLEGVEKSLNAADFGAQAMCDSYIVQLLVLLGRLSARAEAALPVESVYDEKIAAVLSYVNENLTAPLSVEELADRVHISRYHFMRLFKAQTGTSVHAYVRQRRLMHAAHLIREGASAARAAEESGFADYSAFHRAFTAAFGVSPGKLKRS